MKRFCITLTALCALLLAPLLGDAVACAAARACAVAPCCVARSVTCPMHNSDSQHGCRMRSCGAHDDLSSVQSPQAAYRPLSSVFRIDVRPVTLSHAAANSITSTALPPEPPPPRLG